MSRDTHHTNSESFLSNSHSITSSYQSQQICQNQYQKSLLPSNNSLDLVVSLVRTEVEKRPSYFHVRLIPSKPDRISSYPTQHGDRTYLRTDTNSNIHGYCPQSIQHTQNSGTFLESSPGSNHMNSYSQENNGSGMSTNKRMLLPSNNNEETYSAEHSLRYLQEFSQNIPQNIPQTRYQDRYIGPHVENNSIAHQNNMSYSAQQTGNDQQPHYIRQDRMYQAEIRENSEGQKVMTTEKKHKKELNKPVGRASNKEVGQGVREKESNENTKTSLSTGYLFDPAMNLWTSTRYAAPANIFESSGVTGRPAKANSWNSLAESWINSGEGDTVPHNMTSMTSPLVENTDDFRNSIGPQSSIKGQSYLDDSESRTKSMNKDGASSTLKRDGSSSGSRGGSASSESQIVCDNSGYVLANTDTDGKKNIPGDESTSFKNREIKIPRNISSQEHSAEDSSNPRPSSRNRKPSDSSLREYFRFSEDNGGDREEGSYLALEGRALEPSTDIDVDADVVVLADNNSAEHRENRDSVNGNSDENENENGSDSRSVAREYASVNTSSGYNYDNFFDDLMDVATSADIEGYYDPRPV